MDFVSGACRRAVGALWYALTVTLYAPVRWAVGQPQSTPPIEADWKVILPVAGLDYNDADDGNEFRLWWDALPETSAHGIMEDDDDALAGHLHSGR